jgi:2-oxoglutarate ferredoxin oxidoreductase subunit alpha
MVGQGDVMQAKYGSHGDYPVIALSPSSVQDMFDLTIRAFNLSERYRVPTMVLSDAEIGHMRGKFIVPRTLEIVNRRIRTDRVWHDGFAYDETLVPKMPIFGKGSRVHVTGLSHDIAGYPTSNVEVHEELVRRLQEKVERHSDDICSLVAHRPGSRRMLVSYGSPSFAAWEAMMQSEDVGLVDLKTLWPFPSKLLAQAISGSSDVIMIELNLGQMFREVQRVACDEGCRKVRLFSKVGGEVPRPAEIIGFLKEGG